MSAPTKTLCSVSTKFSARTDGFTMIEILTVVAIIAVLAFIGFPALARALETANNGKCKANLKTLASACLAYAADNNGYLPANGPQDKSQSQSHVTRWSRFGKQMAPYGLGSPNKAWACLCPSDKNDLTMRPGSLTSYAIPGSMSPGSRNAGPWAGRGPSPWPRIQQLSYPSRVIMLFEYFGNHYGDPPGSQCIKVGTNPPATLNVAFLDGSVGTYKQDTDAPWMHLEYHWRTPPNTPLSERVHVLQR
jgi:prepilin-type N-terminal cleavage/methylation domain-containing protein/prepilin-type processing-associated H-X9-DG protein